MRRSRRKPIVSVPAASGWRFAVVLLAMLTFAVQSYVTQTHIHFDAPANSKIAAEPAPHGKHPLQETPANCPICQEMAMAGHYVTPTAMVFALPQQTVAIIPIVLATSFIVEAVSHDWRGRAPPQH